MSTAKQRYRRRRRARQAWQGADSWLHGRYAACDAVCEWVTHPIIVDWQARPTILDRSPDDTLSGFRVT